MKRLLTLILTLVIAASMLCVGAAAKTNPDGQTVGTTLFYITNSAGEEILVSHTSVSELEADLDAGRIDSTNHNYSLLDRYVTTVHQEAQGLTVPDYVTYAQSKSTVSALRDLTLTYAGKDQISLWEIDQSGYDTADTYTYDELYGVQRYNFPLLYQYWNYRTQDYYDPAGKMSRDEVVNYILANGEQETVMLSVRAFSERYMVSDQYDTGDYAMENLWYSGDLLDSARTLRVMKPMTAQELRDKTATASDTRYWVANLRLDMTSRPTVKPLGKVAAPTATMTEDASNYYITFSCATPGAMILYNHNFNSPSYTPTHEYTGGTVMVPKSSFPGGTVTMTCRAVRDGYTDAGVQTLKLTASGMAHKWSNPYSDVPDTAWYFDNVQYVTEHSLFDAMGNGNFSPEAPMTRAMLATALYRIAGNPKTAGITDTPFTDVTPSAAYADAVAWCYSAGVVYGTTDTTFTPGASITREQIVTMFHRYADKVAKADMSVSDPLTKFADKSKLSAYAVESMQWAVAAGLISGMTSTTIVPQGTATRAQTAAMVQRLANFLG